MCVCVGGGGGGGGRGRGERGVHKAELMQEVCASILNKLDVWGTIIIIKYRRRSNYASLKK